MGATVGIEVDTKGVGALDDVGVGVGRKVGCVGKKNGDRVGRRVGDDDGNAEGDHEGCNEVLLTLHDDDGLGDGRSDGCVGLGDGLEDGWASCAIRLDGRKTSSHPKQLRIPFPKLNRPLAHPSVGTTVAPVK